MSGWKLTQANAAYTIAQFYLQKIRDLPKAHDWITQAVRLAPGNAQYQNLLAAVNRDMERP